MTGARSARRTRVAAYLGIAFGVCCTPLLARAQERPADQPLDEVRVTAEQDDPRRYTNASRFTVPHEDLVKYGDTSLLDALKRVPGVTVTGTDVRFRGLGPEYTQILINGDPAPLGFTVDSISPDAVERLEIYKTPVAGLSAQSIAGTINIVLKQKTKDRHLSAKAGVGYAQGNKSPSLTVEGSDTFKHFSFQLTGIASKNAFSESSFINESDYDASRALITQRVIGKAFDNQEVTYSLTPDLIWKTDLDTLDWQLLAQRFRHPWRFDLNEQTLVGEPSDYPYSLSQGPAPTTDLYKSNLTWTHTFSSARSLESRLNLTYSGKHSSNWFNGDDPEGEPALNRHVVAVAIDRVLVSKERYVQQLTEAHAFVAGWEGSVTQRTESRLQLDRVTPVDPVYYTLDQAYDARILKKALYAEDDWTVSSTLDVYLGARIQQTNVRLSGADFGSTSNNTTLFSPIAQVIWKMPYDAKDQIRLGIAHTTREPTTADLIPRRYTVNTDNGPANPDGQGNPYLRPERAWGLDASYESYFHDDGMVSVSGYLRHVDDVIIPTLFTDGTEWVSSTANSGTAVTYGTELEFKWPLQKLLAGHPKLELKGDVSANWSHVHAVPGPRNRLADQIPLSANLGFEYQPTHALTAGASMRYTSAYTAQATPFVAYYSSATEALDLYGVWAFNPTMRLRLAYDNVFHRNEVQGTLYADPTGASNRYATGDPGNDVKLTFEISF